MPGIDKLTAALVTLSGEPENTFAHAEACVDLLTADSAHVAYAVQSTVADDPKIVADIIRKLITMLGSEALPRSAAPGRKTVGRKGQVDDRPWKRSRLRLSRRAEILPPSPDAAVCLR